MSTDSNPPTVSVIMPSYNHERFVGRAIESVLCQTVDDIELIIIDDCSTDGSAEIIHRYGDVDARVRPCFHQRNLGIPVTFNDGLARATGEYVAFIGSDDEWISHKLERQLEVLSSEPDAVAWSEGLLIDESGRPTGKTFSQVFDPYDRKKDGSIFLELMRGNYICASSVVTRREHFDNIRFDESIPLLNDFLVMLQLAHEHPWRFIEEPLVRYRWHSGQSIHNYRDTWDSDISVVNLRLAEEYSDELPGDVLSGLFVTAAEAFARQGDGTNARRSRRHVLEHHVDNMGARERLLLLDWGICFPDGWRLHVGDDANVLVSDGDTHASAGNGLGRTGVGLAANGDFEGALVYFEKITDIKPGDVRNVVNVAGCLRALSRFEEALHRYKEALEAAPDDILCALNTARCLECLGRDEEALQCCEKALELLVDVQREDTEYMKGLRQDMDGAYQYIKLLEEEERKKGVELEKAGEYARKLEQLTVDQAAALVAVKQAGVPRMHYEQQEPGIFGLFKRHIRNEGLLATYRRSLAYAAKKLKRN